MSKSTLGPAPRTEHLVLAATLLLLRFLVLCRSEPNNMATVYLMGNQTRKQSCQEAQLHCLGLNGCRQALNNFLIQCNGVITGLDNVTSKNCPIVCKHALISLFSAENEAGVAFINCDCHNKMCSERKLRVEFCKNEVMDSVDLRVLHQQSETSSAPVSCNLAKWFCEAEASCLTALRYYYDRCEKLFTGTHRCSSKCKNSLRILSRQPRAAKLRTCVCDGSEDFDCRVWKMNTERFCLKSKQHLSEKTSKRKKRRRRKWNRKDLWRKKVNRRGQGRKPRRRGRHRRKRRKRNPRHRHFRSLL